MLYDMPGDLLLRMVETQKVYFDKNSIERSTGRVRNKYKLAGNVLSPLGIYTFFVITTNESSCHPKTTIKVEKHHWEDKHPSHLNAAMSYVNIKNVEPLTGKELILKMRDTDNGFKRVARLCTEKFEELKIMRTNVNFGGYISDHRRIIVEQALADVGHVSDISDDILIKLGLL